MHCAQHISLHTPAVDLNYELHTNYQASYCEYKKAFILQSADQQLYLY